MANRWRVGFAIAALSIAPAACRDTTGTDEPVAAAIDVRLTSDTVPIGSTTFAIARVVDREGDELDVAIKFRSSDTTIARVYPENGAVVGMSGGDAWVVASFEQFRDSVQVTVVGVAAP